MPYKAFTVPQTRDIIKELSTLEYLAWEGDVKERWITDLEDLNLKNKQTIEDYKKVLDGKNSLIGTQEAYMENQYKLITIHSKGEKKAKTALKIVSGVSIGIIGFLLLTR